MSGRTSGVKGRTEAAVSAVRDWVRARPGRSGLAVGAAAGLAAGLLLGSVVLPAMRAGDGLEPGPLRIMTSVDMSEGGQRGELIKQWETIHRRDVQVIDVSPSPDKAHAEMLAAGGEVDIYNLDVTWIAEFAATGRIRPLDRGRLEQRGLVDGFLEEPWRTGEYDGQLWALPFNTDAGLLYYRTYPDGGSGSAQRWPSPPQSWVDIAADAEAALNPGHPRHDPKLVAGYTGQLVNDEILTVNALEAIWAEGGDVVDGQGEVVINSEEAERGLRRLRQVLDPDSQLVLRDSLQHRETDSTRAFAEGRVLFMRNWPVAYRTLHPTGQPKKVDFAVTTLPGKRSVLGGQSLAIASGTDRPKAAQALIEFLTGERSQQLLFAYGGFAATREIVYLDPNLSGKHPYAKTLLEAIRGARSRPVTPHYSLFSEVFRDVVLEALHGDGEFTEEHARRLADALRGKQRQ